MRLLADLADQAQLEALKRQLQDYQHTTKHQLQQHDTSSTLVLQPRGASHSPDQPEGVVCTTTAGGAMMRRARFRRAVSCAKNSHSGSAAASSPDTDDIVTSKCLRSVSKDGAISHPHGTTKLSTRELREHTQHASHTESQGGWQQSMDADLLSHTAELGSVRDSRALSIPDSTATLRTSPPPEYTAEPKVQEQHHLKSSVEGYSTTGALELCSETVNAIVPPESGISTSTEPKDPNLYSGCRKVTQGSAYEIQALQVALEASTTQNTRLKVSLAAMREEIEKLQQNHLSITPNIDCASSKHVGHVISVNGSQNNAFAPDSDHVDNDRVMDSTAAAPLALPNAGDGVSTVPVQQNRPASTDSHQLVALQPDRDSSEPFSSIRDASLRAASLHAAIMAATGGQTSALDALEATVDRTQQTQTSTADVGLQVPELEDGNLLQVERQECTTSTHNADTRALQTSPSDHRLDSKLTQLLESERTQWGVKEKELCHERDAALSRMERLQQENERLMELGAELRAEKEILVCHLPPAFVEAVCSGTLPPAAAMSCINGGSGPHVLLSHVGGHKAPLTQVACWDNIEMGTNGQDTWAAQDLPAAATASRRRAAHEHSVVGALMNTQPTELSMWSVQNTPQRQRLAQGDAHAFDFLCQNLNPNIDSIGGSLWVQESQLSACPTEKAPDEPRAQFVPDLLDPEARHDELSEAPQQLQKGVDTSDLNGQRQEAAIVTVGGQLEEGQENTGTKGMQVGLRSSAQRWPVSNSARGTISQRTRLHALSKRRDGKTRADGAGFAPSIKARNWNVAVDD